MALLYIPRNRIVTMKNPVMLHLTNNVYRKSEDLVLSFFLIVSLVLFIHVVFSAFPNAADQKINLLKITF